MISVLQSGVVMSFSYGSEVCRAPSAIAAAAQDRVTSGG